MGVSFAKKGIFFTFIAIVLVSVMVLVYTGIPKINAYGDPDIIDVKYAVFESYNSDLEERFIEDVLKTQGFLALQAMVEYVDTKNAALPISVNDTFKELVYNGSINQEQQLMMVTNISNFTDEISKRSLEYFGINTNITFYDVYLEQNNPWFVTAYANVSILTTEKGMKYFVNKTYSVNISIIGFKDPLYLIHSQLMTRYIKPRRAFTDYRTTNEPLWLANTEPWNETTVLKMIRESTYSNSTFAPSFLMRFLDDTSPSKCCGIQSLINGSYPDLKVSYVDYKYFHGEPVCPPAQLNRYATISGTPEALGFKLDLNNDEPLYNLSWPTVIRNLEACP